jgi:hypothetical protein
VTGRENGTIFQLRPVMIDRVLSTLKFIDTQNKEDHDMSPMMPVFKRCGLQIAGARVL